MYITLLAIHSLLRWLVVISLVYALYRAYRGWFSHAPFTKLDNTIRYTTSAIVQIQLIFGLWLYYSSPIINYFLHHFGDAIHERQVRFFGMEHSLMMVIAVMLVTAGSAMAKRKPTDTQKFKTMAIWFTLALLIILTSIPWAFSPFTSRPYFRTF